MAWKRNENARGKLRLGYTTPNVKIFWTQEIGVKEEY